MSPAENPLLLLFQNPENESISIYTLNLQQAVIAYYVRFCFPTPLSNIFCSRKLLYSNRSEFSDILSQCSLVRLNMTIQHTDQFICCKFTASRLCIWSIIRLLKCCWWESQYFFPPYTITVRLYYTITYSPELIKSAGHLIQKPLIATSFQFKSIVEVD